MSDQVQKRSRQERFGLNVQRLWEALVTQIKHDIAKMNAGIKPKNATGLPIMEGKIEVNGHRLIPGPYELHIDKPTAPAREDGYFERPMFLTIQLDIETESIKIIERYTPETQLGINSDENVKGIEIIQLLLADDHVYVKDKYGKELRIEQLIEGLSESILSRFLAYPRRKCGTRPKKRDL